MVFIASPVDIKFSFWTRIPSIVFIVEPNNPSVLEKSKYSCAPVSEPAIIIIFPIIPSLAAVPITEFSVDVEAVDISFVEYPEATPLPSAP